MITDAKEIPFDIEEYYRQNFPPGMSEASKNRLLNELSTAKKKAPRTFSLELRNKAERRYKRLLKDLFQTMEEKIAGLTDPDEIVSALRFFAESPQFGRVCEEAARQMATMLAVGQKADWRAAAQASSQGRMIYKLLMQETTNTTIGQTISNIVAENAQLIKTVPQNMAGKISELARKRLFEGIRPEDITKEILEQQPHLLEYEARRIARTESAKASTALTQARAEEFNFPFYVWHSVNDERTRSAHASMNGILCRWSDPPNPEALFPGEDSHNSGGCYHPGGIYNCRCSASPVTHIEDISFPVTMHVSGGIETISSVKAFKERFGNT